MSLLSKASTVEDLVPLLEHVELDLLKVVIQRALKRKDQSPYAGISIVIRLPNVLQRLIFEWIDDHAPLLEVCIIWKNIIWEMRRKNALDALLDLEIPTQCTSTHRVIRVMPQYRALGIALDQNTFADLENALKTLSGTPPMEYTVILYPGNYHIYSDVTILRNIQIVAVFQVD